MEEYIGVIKIFCGYRIPQNFYFCEGQLLSINKFPALFSIIGNSFGGDGHHDFALPDLRYSVDGIKKWESGKPRYIICVDGIYPNFE